MATLTSLQESIAQLTTTVNSIKSDVTELKTSKSKIETVDSTVKSQASEITRLINLVEDDSLKIKLLSAIVIKQDTRIAHLEKQVNTLQKQDRKANLLISGLIGQVDDTLEECIELAQDFFKQQMGIQSTIKIRYAYWVGAENNCSLMVKLKNPDDKPVIFSNISTLKGKSNIRKKLFFVNDDLQDEEKEQRNYYCHLINENKDREEGSKLQIFLRKGKLTANNELIKSNLSVPSATDVITLEPSELEQIHATKTYKSDKHVEAGSEFFCHYQKVKSVKEVQQGLNKMKIKYGDANHTVTAYKLPDAEGPFKQGFEDNVEWGAGWRMLEELKNKNQEGIAVFITRYSEGTKMGARRFEVYRDLTQKAVRKFKEKQE